jgi:methylmalonyl-CoA/ethylmalonyl-CoA epimerase
LGRERAGQPGAQGYGPLSPLGFHHHAVSVPDLEQAIGWYGEVFGFAEEFRFGIPGAEVVMLKRGDLRIELFCVADAATLPEGRSDPQGDVATHGNKHVAFAVPSLDQALKELAQKGVEPVFISSDGPQSIAFIRDCFGNLIELVEAY